MNISDPLKKGCDKFVNVCKVFFAKYLLYVQLVTLLQIRTIDRKQEVPHDGPMCDLLWSDPEGELSMLVHVTQLPL